MLVGFVNISFYVILYRIHTMKDRIYDFFGQRQVCFAMSVSNYFSVRYHTKRLHNSFFFHRLEVEIVIYRKRMANFMFFPSDSNFLHNYLWMKFSVRRYCVILEVCRRRDCRRMRFRFLVNCSNLSAKIWATRLFSIAFAQFEFIKAFNKRYYHILAAHFLFFT